MRYGEKRTEKCYGKWTTTTKTGTLGPYSLDGGLEDAIKLLQRIQSNLPDGFTHARLDWRGGEEAEYVVYAERDATPEEIKQAEEQERKQQAERDAIARRQYEELKRLFEGGK